MDMVIINSTTIPATIGVLMHSLSRLSFVAYGGIRIPGMYVYKFLNDMWDYYDIPVSINTYVTDGNTVEDAILCRVVSLEKNRHKIEIS